MRREAVIDLVPTDVAEVLIRNRSRRPNWLPAGYPMKLILSQKRNALIAYLIDHPSLRTHLRISSRRLIDLNLLSGVAAVDFDGRLERAAIHIDLLRQPYLPRMQPSLWPPGRGYCTQSSSSPQSLQRPPQTRT